MRFTVDVYQHGFVVTTQFENDKQLVRSYLDKFCTYDVKFDRVIKRQRKILKAVYGVIYKKKTSVGMVISEYDAFMSYLLRRSICGSDILVRPHMPYLFNKGDIKLKETAIPKPAQEPIIDFIMSPGRIKVLPVQTGGGKTFCSLYVIAKEQKRVAITMAAMHVDTWLKDINKFYENDDCVYIVRGKKSFVDLINVALNDLPMPTIIIFTVNTIRDYFTEYEEEGKSSYGVDPHELYETLGVSWRIVDEAHENLQFGFRHAINTNVNKVLYLSATISSHNPTINQMYLALFPIADRYVGPAWNKYIVATALGYMLREPRSVQCNGSMGYSHVIYEQWIMKDHKRLMDYLELIHKVVIGTYIKMYLPGQKMLIYAGSIKMIEQIENYLRVKLFHVKDKNHVFSVHAYTGEHEDVVLHSHDIVVTTPKKAGSGKDVKGLAVVLSTVNMDAKESSIQMLGRLRVIEDLYPGVDPLFYYLVCLDIPKHQLYHRRKMELFAPLVKRITATKVVWSI